MEISTPEGWREFVGNTTARENDILRWIELEGNLEEATRLFLDEGWRIDAMHPGVVAKHGSDERRLVSLETCCLIRAIARGIGEAVLQKQRGQL